MRVPLRVSTKLDLFSSVLRPVAGTGLRRAWGDVAPLPTAALNSGLFLALR